MPSAIWVRGFCHLPDEPIPTLNAIFVNVATGILEKGVNYYLEHYYEPDESVAEMSNDDKRAVVEEIQQDNFSYEYWDDVLEEFGLEQIRDGIEDDDEEADEIEQPRRGGWSSEGESEWHKP